MLLLTCPWCGPRDETEFHYGGQAHVPHPADPAALDDRQWADYVFYRDNPKGPFAERWMHATGCRRWFNALRDTASYRILATYRLHEARPAAPPDDRPQAAPPSAAAPSPGDTPASAPSGGNR
ncbi:sarcosine oxidase subunit delta [Streptomyces sp. NPDC048644]|uniref:sarcosine oxidase subunit delta n=1 Tax=Streptomyces sp. NPDC048644 TaxID=3365582 RepID=UPI00371D0094